MDCLICGRKLILSNVNATVLKRQKAWGTNVFANQRFDSNPGILYESNISTLVFNHWVEGKQLVWCLTLMNLITKGSNHLFGSLTFWTQWQLHLWHTMFHSTIPKCSPCQPKNRSCNRLNLYIYDNHQHSDWKPHGVRGIPEVRDVLKFKVKGGKFTALHLHVKVAYEAWWSMRLGRGLQILSEVLPR